MLIEAIVLAGIVATFPAAAFFSGSKAQKRRRRVWRGVAESRGGRYYYQSSFLQGATEYMTVPLAGHQGHHVRLETMFHNDGNHNRIYTRVIAPYAVSGGGPTFRIYRQGLLASVGKALGAQDALLGNDEFDRLFVVKTDSTALLRRLLRSELQHQMVTRFSQCRLESDGHRLRLVIPAVWHDVEALNATLDFTIALSTCDLFGTTALLQTNGSRRQKTQHWPEVIIDTPTPVTIGPRLLGDDLKTCAWIRQATTIPSLTSRIEPDVAAEMAKTLPQAAQQLLRRVGRGTLVIDSEGPRFWWDDICESPHAMRVAADFLSALFTAPAQGTYR